MSHIILFGNMRCSLTLARSLARDGHTIHAGYDELDPFLVASRCVRGSFHHPPPDRHPEAALQALFAHLDRHPEIDVLIPVSDIATRLISRQRERFPKQIRLIVADAVVVEHCINKAAMFELCERLGVALARRRIVTDHAALLDAVAEIGTPCVVKPVDACHYLFDRKAIILREIDEAPAALPHWPAEHASLCVQRFVDGPRHDISFAAHRGQLIGAVDCEVLQTDRQDGTGYTTRLVSRRPHLEVARGVESIVHALNYTGVGDIEFMVDERSGQVSFIELNPRLSASFKSAEVCGLPVSRLMLQLGLGMTPPARPDPWSYPIGQRTVWTKGDLAGVKRQRRQDGLGRLGAFRQMVELLGAAFARHHLTLDWRDAVPTAWLYLHPVLRRLGLSPIRLPGGTTLSASAIAVRPTGRAETTIAS